MDICSKIRETDGWMDMLFLFCFCIWFCISCFAILCRCTHIALLPIALLPCCLHHVPTLLSYVS